MQNKEIKVNTNTTKSITFFEEEDEEEESENKHEKCQIDLFAFKSFLETISEEPSPSTNIALIKIQEYISLNQELTLPIITNENIEVMINLINTEETCCDSLTTLSLIQTYTREFTDMFKSQFFIDIVRNVVEQIGPMEMHSLSSLLANIACDDKEIIRILIDSEILNVICFRNDFKQSSETKRLISIALTNEFTPIEMFNDILNSQISFLKEFVILPGESQESEEIDENEEDLAKKEEENYQKYINRISKKYSILHSFDYILTEKQKEESSKDEILIQKCQRICDFMLNNDILRYLIAIVKLQISLSCLCLRILLYSFSENSQIASSLYAMNIIDDLKTLINSHNTEIMIETMKFVSLIVVSFPEMSHEGLSCFKELDYITRFQEGNFSMKKSVINLLINIIQDFTEDEKKELFQPNFVSDLCDILDIEKEKIIIYTLFAKLLSIISDCSWIFEILEDFDFWGKVEDDHYNSEDESLIQITEDLLKMHEQLPQYLEEQKIKNEEKLEEEEDFTQ